MPPSWSPKIYIDKDKYLKGTLLGEETTFYIKVKVERYSDYVQSDGLVTKYTLFDVLCSLLRITKKLKLGKLDICISIEPINSKNDIDILMNLGLLNYMVLVKCLIGKKLLKLIEE